MLIVAIFGIFWRTTKTNEALNKLRIANEQMLVTQARLQNVFSGVTTHKTPKPYFFVEHGTNLVFTIENTIQHDPAFSVNALIKLYLENEQLILATFPYFEEETELPKVMQKETLLSDVTDFRMEFFLGQDGQQEQDETVKKPPMGRWTDNWLKEYDRAPQLIKLHIKSSKNPPCTLWIFLPDMIGTILYDKG